MPNNDDLDLGLTPAESLPLTVRVKTKLNKALQDLKLWWQGLSKGQKIGVGLGVGFAAVIILGGSLVWVLKRGQSRSPYETAPPTPIPAISLELSQPTEPKDHENPINGVMMTKSEFEEALTRKPLLVMMDNLVDARPQTGLNQADLVYEALVEGGITRFMPLYWQSAPQKVGPVRSMRAYFLDWIAEWGDPLFMHIGGAGGPETNSKANALAMIQQYGMKSVGISVGGNFWREPGKVAPHNAYSSTVDLWEKAKNINWIGPAKFESFKFKDDEKKENRPESGEVKFSWNGWGQSAYSVTWTYESKDNLYFRKQGGQTQTDDETGEQLNARNVILQFSLQTLANDARGHILYETVGSGRALIFRDGKVIEGTWEKTSRTARTKFYDENGSEVELNRGRIWIEVVPTGSEISY